MCIRTSRAVFEYVWCINSSCGIPTGLPLAQADRRALNITLNSIGTELTRDDRRKLYSNFGLLYPHGHTELAGAEDFEQIRSAMEKCPPYQAIFNKVGQGAVSGVVCCAEQQHGADFSPHISSLACDRGRLRMHDAQRFVPTSRDVSGCMGSDTGPWDASVSTKADGMLHSVLNVNAVHADGLWRDPNAG